MTDPATPGSTAPGPRRRCARRWRPSACWSWRSLALGAGLALTQPGIPRSARGAGGCPAGTRAAGHRADAGDVPWAGHGSRRAHRARHRHPVWRWSSCAGSCSSCCRPGLSPAVLGRHPGRHHARRLRGGLAPGRAAGVRRPDRPQLDDPRRRPPAWLAVDRRSCRPSQLAMLIGAGDGRGAGARGRARGRRVAAPAGLDGAGHRAGGRRRAVAVGVTNAEGHPETYRLVATLDGEPLTTIDGRGRRQRRLGDRRPSRCRPRARSCARSMCPCGGRSDATGCGALSIGPALPARGAGVDEGAADQRLLPAHHRRRRATGRSAGRGARGPWPRRPGRHHGPARTARPGRRRRRGRRPPGERRERPAGTRRRSALPAARPGPAAHHGHPPPGR